MTDLLELSPKPDIQEDEEKLMLVDEYLTNNWTNEIPNQLKAKMAPVEAEIVEVAQVEAEMSAKLPELVEMERKVAKAKAKSKKMIAAAETKSEKKIAKAETKAKQKIAKALAKSKKEIAEKEAESEKKTAEKEAESEKKIAKKEAESEKKIAEQEAKLEAKHKAEEERLREMEANFEERKAYYQDVYLSLRQQAKEAALNKEKEQFLKEVMFREQFNEEEAKRLQKEKAVLAKQMRDFFEKKNVLDRRIKALKEANVINGAEVLLACNNKLCRQVMWLNKEIQVLVDQVDSLSLELLKKGYTINEVGRILYGEDPCSKKGLNPEAPAYQPKAGQHAESGCSTPTSQHAEADQQTKSVCSMLVGQHAEADQHAEPNECADQPKKCADQPEAVSEAVETCSD